MIAVDDNGGEGHTHELLAADRAREIHPEMHRQRIVSVVRLLRLHIPSLPRSARRYSVEASTCILRVAHPLWSHRGGVGLWTARHWRRLHDANAEGCACGFLP